MKTRNNRKSNKRTKKRHVRHKQIKIRTKTKRAYPKQKLTRRKYKNKIFYGGFKFVVKIDNEPYEFDSADIFDGDKENIGQEEDTETIGDLKHFFKENEELSDEYEIVIKNKTNRELLDDVIIRDILNLDKDFLILDKKRKVIDAIGNASRRGQLKMKTGNTVDDRDDEFGALTTNMDASEVNTQYYARKPDREGNIYDGMWNPDNSGNGTIIFANGDVYEGSWAKDLDFIGNGIMTLKLGNIYDGIWNEDGSGSGIITYKSGSKKGGIYKGQWDYNTLMSGQGIYIINGDKYEGTWTPEPNGNGTGYGTITYRDGTVYEGAWDRNVNPIT